MIRFNLWIAVRELSLFNIHTYIFGSARGVMVAVVGDGLGNPVLYPQKEETISLVYKNLNSFIRNVVVVVCMGERET